MNKPIIVKNRGHNGIEYDDIYYPLERFEGVKELRKATEQVVTKDFAEKYLYVKGEELHLFLEQDDILYGNGSYEISPDIARTVGAELIGQKGNSYWFVGEFGTIGEETAERVIEIKLENGIWKLNNTQFDFYFYYYE